MKTSVHNESFRFIRRAVLVTVLTALALVMVALPQKAQANTSGNATIYNTAKVSFTSGSNTAFNYSSVSLTVSVVGASPTITNPANQTVVAGATVTYLFTVKSNGNGLDTYTPSNLTYAPTSVTAASSPSLSGAFTLWAGITVGVASGTVSVPFGTTTGLTAGISTVQIGANQYTVTTISSGSAASTNAGTGALIAEVPAVLTLTPIGASPVISAANAPIGTQLGEFKTSVVTASFQVGAPTTLGTDGTYSSVFTITPTSSGTAYVDPASVTTTVPSPQVTIGKTVSPSGSQPPGTTLTYTVTMKNTHASAQVTGVTLIDLVPAYTTYVASSTTLNGIGVAGDGATSPLIGAGLLIDANAGRTSGQAATGILNAGQTAIVVYKVTIN